MDRSDFVSTEEYIDHLELLVESLKESERKLIALESAGVDNWEGFDYAMELLEEIE